MMDVGTRWILRQPVLNLYAGPEADSQVVTQMLYGETCIILDQLDLNRSCQVSNTAANAAASKTARVRMMRDGYEGVVRSRNVHWQEDAQSQQNLALQHLSPQPEDPQDHKSMMVNTRSTLLFAEPDIKCADTLSIPFGSRLVCHDSSQSEQFLRTDAGYWVWASHVVAVNVKQSSAGLIMLDFARQHFLGIPYLWGGSSPQGFDCSGLVQMAALAAGCHLPRDSHQQEAALTPALSADLWSAGDLVFWPRHVAMLGDERMVLHATAHHLLSVQEPLSDVIARAGEPSSVKRLFS